MPALESAHAVAWVLRAAPAMRKNQSIIVGLSGRGDKDVHTVESALAAGSGNGGGLGHQAVSARTGGRR
jgi:tryptophan synthase beta chain